MTFTDAEKMIKADGWYYSYCRGSHYYYYHPFKKGKVTIPKHGGKDIDIDVIKSIKRQAGLK